METTEKRVKRIISTALCQYRGAMEEEFINQQIRMLAARPGSDAYYIAVDKMLFAAEECHHAHDALNAGCDNPCKVWDQQIIASCRVSLGDKARDAYERDEAEADERALRKFYYDAFGEH